MLISPYCETMFDFWWAIGLMVVVLTGVTVWLIHVFKNYW